MEADQLGRVHDILQATRLIAAHVKDTTFASFHVDSQKQDAVIRRIEIIGEAAAHLSEATRREARPSGSPCWANTPFTRQWPTTA
jgi:uncharacterized protein with HEPN domain